MFCLSTRLSTLLVNISKVPTLLSITTFSKAQSPLAWNNYNTLPNGLHSTHLDIPPIPFTLQSEWPCQKCRSDQTTFCLLSSWLWENMVLTGLAPLYLFSLIMNEAVPDFWYLVLSTRWLPFRLPLTISLCTHLFPLSRKIGSTFMSYHFNPLSLWGICLAKHQPWVNLFSWCKKKKHRVS